MAIPLEVLARLVAPPKPYQRGGVERGDGDIPAAWEEPTPIPVRTVAYPPSTLATGGDPQAFARGNPYVGDRMNPITTFGGPTYSSPQGPMMDATFLDPQGYPYALPVSPQPWDIPMQVQYQQDVVPNYASLMHAGINIKPHAGGGVAQPAYETLDRIKKDHTNTPKGEDISIPQRYQKGGVAVPPPDYLEGINSWSWRPPPYGHQFDPRLIPEHSGYRLPAPNQNVILPAGQNYYTPVEDRTVAPTVMAAQGGGVATDSEDDPMWQAARLLGTTGMDATAPDATFQGGGVADEGPYGRSSFITTLDDTRGIQLPSAPRIGLPSATVSFTPDWRGRQGQIIYHQAMNALQPAGRYAMNVLRPVGRALNFYTGEVQGRTPLDIEMGWGAPTYPAQVVYPRATAVPVNAPSQQTTALPARFQEAMTPPMLPDYPANPPPREAQYPEAVRPSAMQVLGYGDLEQRMGRLYDEYGNPRPNPAPPESIAPPTTVSYQGGGIVGPSGMMFDPTQMSAAYAQRAPAQQSSPVAGEPSPKGGKKAQKYEYGPADYYYFATTGVPPAVPVQEPRPQVPAKNGGVAKKDKGVAMKKFLQHMAKGGMVKFGPDDVLMSALATRYAAKSKPNVMPP